MLICEIKKNNFYVKMRTSFDTFNLKRNCKGNSSHSEYEILFIKSPLGKNKCRMVITLTWC